MMKEVEMVTQLWQHSPGCHLLLVSYCLHTQLHTLLPLFTLFYYCIFRRKRKNIARGTTDPEIDSETWTKLGNNMTPLALIANLATRWRHLTFSH